MRTFRIVADGFILREGKVLLGKRATSEKFLPGHWELIGGKVEWGEEPQHALAREIREELHTTPMIGEQFHSFSYISGNTDYLLLAFSAEIPVSEVSSSCHAELRWVSPNELEALQITPQMRETLWRGFARFRK